MRPHPRAQLFVALWAVAMTTTGCLVSHEPVKEERRGDFLIQRRTQDGFGHRATSVTILDNSAGRPSEIATVRGYFIPVHDPALLVYDTCQESEPCRLWYYDSRRHQRQLVASGQEVSISQLEDEDRWSPHGCCFILTGQYHAVLVNTLAEKSFDLQEPLKIGRPVNPINGRFRQVYFKGWDPLSDAATLEVISPVGGSDWDRETYLVTNSGETRLIATVRK